MISYTSRQAPMASVTSPVSKQLVGPDGTAVSGLVADAPAPGPGSLIDARLDALEAVVFGGDDAG
jgi:hypothetical protein